MQTSASNDKGSFGPIAVTIILESKEEAEAFYSILNHSAICDAVCGILNLTKIRQAMNAASYGLSRFNYTNFFEKFNRRLARHPSIN